MSLGDLNTEGNEGLLDSMQPSVEADPMTAGSHEPGTILRTKALDLTSVKPATITIADVAACFLDSTAKESLFVAENLIPRADKFRFDVLEKVVELALERKNADQDASKLQMEVDRQGTDGEYTLLRRARSRLEDWKALYPEFTQSIDDTTAHRQEEEDKLDGTDLDIDNPWAEAEAEAVDGSHKAIGDTGTNIVSSAEEEVDVDDPWAEAQSDSEGEEPIAPGSSLGNTTPEAAAPTPRDYPLPISDFITLSFPELIASLSQSVAIREISILRDRHPAALFPLRLVLLDSMPEWVTPAELGDAGLLPAVNNGREVKWSHIGSASQDTEEEQMESDLSQGPLTQAEIAQWYSKRVEDLDILGLVDTQVAWVQQAAARGVSGLDELGEDLSLLARLVYDASLSEEDQAIWNLSYWRSATSKRIVQAYLSSANPNNIVHRVKTLVLPYLYVLESRAERSGKPDKGVVDRHLTEAILALPLDLALAVFESSKATLNKHDRIIKDDLVVARLALALLYGSDATSSTSTHADWTTRSAIFECLPVWDVSGRDPEDDAELTSTTLDSIAAFVRPSPSQPRPPRPEDLMMFFTPLPFSSLSRALDILDVHLESGEILARWNTPVEMRFLLQSARDPAEQIELCERLVKRVATQPAESGGRGKRGKEDEEKWVRLWDDLLRLNGSGDQLLRGAFGMVDGDEIMRVYLAGLLRGGKLDTARKMITRLESTHSLTSETLEKVVLQTSRELYDMAESGNVHTGDMKLAYDCLAVAPQTPTIQREKDFIEATSRLATFGIPSNISSRSSSSSSSSSFIRPREVRSMEDKLQLIALVLTHSPDAFRHETMMLELAKKLGVAGDVQTGRVYSHMAGIAVQQAEWDLAVEYTEKGLNIIQDLDKRVDRGHRMTREKASMSVRAGTGEEGSEEAALRSDICETALRVGSSVEWTDVERKLALLGQAIATCPPNLMSKILEVWSQVEQGRIRLDTAAKRRRIEGISVDRAAIGSGSEVGKGSQGQRSTHPGAAAGRLLGAFGLPTNSGNDAGSGSTAAEERVLGSRRAARAARMALDLGGMLGSHLPRSASPASAQAAPIGSAAVGGSLFGLRRDSGARGSSGSLRSLRDAHAQGAVDRTRSPDSAHGGRGRLSGEYSRALDGLGAATAKEDGGLGMEDVDRVRRGARRALVSGVGWLLGAEEGEI